MEIALEESLSYMLTNKYKHAEHGNLAPLLYLAFAALCGYAGWNLKEDWDNFWGGDDGGSDGDGFEIPLDINVPGGGFLMLALIAGAAFFVARRK